MVARYPRVTLPAFRQDAHTFCRFGVLPTRVRTRWMFGFQRRLVRRWEWEMLFPKPGPLPQTSQVEATVRSFGEADPRFGDADPRSGQGPPRNRRNGVDA